MDQREAHVVVTGRVQGVWFRASTVEVAKKADVRGYVRNLPGNSVEALIQGRQDRVEEVIEFMKKGPPGALVTDIKIKWRSPGKEHETFQVRY